MTKRVPPYPPEVRSRAVRMVQDQQGEHASQWSAICWIAENIGCSGETLRHWVRQAERAQHVRSGATTDERERIKALERENRELHQANEILRKANKAFVDRVEDHFDGDFVVLESGPETARRAAARWNSRDDGVLHRHAGGRCSARRPCAGPTRPGSHSSQPGAVVRDDPPGRPPQAAIRFNSRATRAPEINVSRPGPALARALVNHRQDAEGRPSVICSCTKSSDQHWFGAESTGSGAPSGA